MHTVPVSSAYKETTAQWTAVSASFCGLLFGYDMGAIAGAITPLKSAFVLTPASEAWIVAAAIAGAIPAAAFGGRFADHFGRRHLALAASLLSIFTSLVTALAPSVASLIAGRALAGLAIGVCSFIGPLYISEIAPAESRGSLVTVNQLMIAAGILIAYSVDLLLAPRGHWRWMFAAEIVPAAALGLAMFRLPESPRWLILQRKFDEARHVLSSVRPTEDEVEDEVILIESAAWDGPLAESRGPLKALFARPSRPALIIGIVLAVLQQLTGIYTLTFYAPAIFQLIGLAPGGGAIVAVFGIGAVNIFITVLALNLLDRVGRRPLLLAGIGGMTSSLAVLALVFRVENTTTTLSFVAVLSILIYAGSFTLGFGAIFWLFIAEIFPLRIRGLAMGVATAANFAANLAAAVCSRAFVDRAGLGNSFWIYTLIAAVSFAFAYWTVPETRGWMLEDISERLDCWQRQSHGARR